MKTSISHIALLTGVLALSAGTAFGQVTNPPFTIGDAYAKHGNGEDRTPVGTDLTQAQIPGLTVVTTPQVLETYNGTVIPTSITGVINKDGTPVTTPWSAEATTATQTLGAGNTGATSGYYLVNSANQLVSKVDYAAAGLNANSTYSEITAKGFSEVNPDAYDPSNSYKWVTAKYGNDPASKGAFTTAADQGGTAGQYIVDSSGKLITNPASSLTSLHGSAFTAALDAAGYKLVNSETIDPILNVPTNYTFGAVKSSEQGTGNGSVNVNQGAHASTTSLAGGAVYANDKGQHTAIGPDGINAVGASITVQNGAGTSKTNITDGVITSTTPGYGTTQINGGYVTILGGANTNAGGTAATLTYSNAALAVNGGAYVNDGLHVGGGATVSGGLSVAGGVKADNVTVSGNTTTNTLKVNNSATVNGPLTVNGQTQLNGGLSVGGTTITDVATPVNTTDAANKGYVDNGLSALTQTMNNKFGHADAGIAGAMALVSPDRKGNETWAFNVSESFWNDKYATGFNGIFQVADWGTYSLAVGGGGFVASNGDYGGRIVGQIAGGGGYVPLK